MSRSSHNQTWQGAGETRCAVSLLLLCGLGLLLTGCSSRVEYTWGWYVFNPVAPGGRKHILLMLAGLKMTVLVTLASLIGTQIVGFVLCLMRLT